MLRIVPGNFRPSRRVVSKISIFRIGCSLHGNKGSMPRSLIISSLGFLYALGKILTASPNLVNFFLLAALPS